jgi:hypothetical protein
MPFGFKPIEGVAQAAPFFCACASRLPQVETDI